MATPISPIRVFRAFDLGVAASASANTELDFNLGVEEGIEVYRVSHLATIDQDAVTQVNARVVYDATLHIETGTLEDPEPAADAQFPNSEIVYHCRVEAIAQGADQPDAAIVSGDGYILNYMDVMGRPLLLAQNPTMLFTTNSEAVLVAGEFVLWYRYVRLTREELVNQFLLRR